MTYALDSNIIIHLLHFDPKVLAQRNAVIGRNEQIVIPPYVNFEIQRGFCYGACFGEGKTVPIDLHRLPSR